MSSCSAFTTSSWAWGWMRSGGGVPMTTSHCAWSKPSCMSFARSRSAHKRQVLLTTGVVHSKDKAARACINKVCFMRLI